jgi:hypothetical protein
MILEKDLVTRRASIISIIISQYYVALTCEWKKNVFGALLQLQLERFAAGAGEGEMASIQIPFYCVYFSLELILVGNESRQGMKLLDGF